MARDFYEVLGVSKTATEDEIRKAYRKLARQNHPDRNPGDKQAEARFKEVQEAFEVLNDKSKRAQYDQFGAEGPAGFGGFRSGRGAAGFGGQAVNAEELQELLRQFGGMGMGMGGMGGVGVEDLEDMLRGQTQRGRNGRRRRPQAPPEERAVAVPFLTAALGGSVSLRTADGQIDLKVPAGAEDGKKMRLQGQGAGGGDLIAHLRIEPHPYFRREGKDIVLDVPLSITEAVLGTKVDVPTIKGDRLNVTIKPGTSSGARRRIPKFGIDGGDMYVEIKIVVPTLLDARSRELLEEFARLNPQHPRAGLPWT